MARLKTLKDIGRCAGRTLRDSARTLVAAFALAGCTAAPAPYGGVEMLVGDKAGVVEIAGGATLAPRTGLFAKTRIVADYETADKTIGQYTFADLTFNVVGGLEAVLEPTATTSGGVQPRAGLQYHRKDGDLSLFGQATVRTLHETNFEFLAKVRYTPSIGEGYGLDLSALGICDVDKDFNHTSSSLRLRALLDVQGWKVGPMADLTWSGSEGEFGYNVGGGVRRDF